MRWFYLTIVVIVAVVTLIFALQNTESVNVALFGASMSGPLSVVVFAVYILGAATGGGLFALLRKSVAAARAKE
jgi:lipopolysaccharide assembly protein A